GSRVRFRFRAKSGKLLDLGIEDGRLARIVRRCRDLPGEQLFQYVDETGQPLAVDSGDVNDYLREISGEEFTAKEIRTWAGCVHAFVRLRETGRASSRTTARRRIVEVLRAVARQLGNTVAVCRKYYVDPRLLEAYEDGTLFDGPAARRASSRRRLRREEEEFLAFLLQAITRRAA
ncbi:MAG: DNA topoisomerase IB, partial [Candidatus Eisenbacteria bacterium]|nr:DNA topoisomerase IB [Candidatus Eisenbacteria bacterium]